MVISLKSIFCGNSHISRNQFSGVRKNSSQTASAIRGLTGASLENPFSQSHVSSRLKEHAEGHVSDKNFAERAERWSLDVPETKEAYLIRDIFDGESSYR